MTTTVRFSDLMLDVLAAHKAYQEELQGRELGFNEVLELILAESCNLETQITSQYRLKSSLTLVLAARKKGMVVAALIDVLREKSVSDDRSTARPQG